ncbi:MAG: class III signal peptide-containing protein [Pirellulaceae bacterium]
MSKKFTPRKNRRGQGLVEYIIIVAAVAMIALVAVSVFGHKVADQYAIGAGMLPGAHGEDNAAIAVGGFVETGADANGNIVSTGSVSWASATGNADGDTELENNVAAAGGGPATGDMFVGD